MPTDAKVTLRLIVALTTAPAEKEAKKAPVQPGLPAGRKTSVSPGEAKEPMTWRVVAAACGMAGGSKAMSGGKGGGEGGEGGGAGGGDGGGGGGGGAGGGDGGGGE